MRGMCAASARHVRIGHNRSKEYPVPVPGYLCANLLLHAGDDRFWRPRFLNTLGWVLAEEGNLEEALKLNDLSLREAIETGDPETIHNAAVNVGENHLSLGNLKEARKILDSTWEEVKRSGLSYNRWRYKTRLLIALSELHGGMGERERGLYFARKAVKMAEKSGARKHLARALQAKAGLLAGTRPENALRSFRKARSLAQAMGAELLAQRIGRDMEAMENSGD